VVSAVPLSSPSLMRGSGRGGGLFGSLVFIEVPPLLISY